MGKLEIIGMSFYSHHGCFEQEQIVGNRFIVDFEGETDMTKAAESDCLEDAVNYQLIYNIIKEEMSVTSKILENVAGRILNRVRYEFPQLIHANISVAKMSPPVGGEVESFKVTLSY